jgi:hypothetical protein
MQEHPHTQLPYYGLHPCQTAKLMTLLLSSNASKDEPVLEMPALLPDSPSPSAQLPTVADPNLAMPASPSKLPLLSASRFLQSQDAVRPAAAPVSELHLQSLCGATCCGSESARSDIAHADACQRAHGGQKSGEEPCGSHLGHVDTSQSAGMAGRGSHGAHVDRRDTNMTGGIPPSAIPLLDSPRGLEVAVAFRKRSTLDTAAGSLDRWGLSNVDTLDTIPRSLETEGILEGISLCDRVDVQVGAQLLNQNVEGGLGEVQPHQLCQEEMSTDEGPLRYMAGWLSIVAPPVGLNVPLALYQ